MFTILSSRLKERSHIILQIIGGVLLISMCAQISIPLRPVPITLHTVGVMLIALLYDMRIGLSIISSYIIAGAMGAPVFSGYNSGLQVIMSSRGGYIIGFLLCVYVMNRLKPILNPKQSLGIFLNCMCGTIATFACGISWLSLYIGGKNAILYGLVPFIIPGIIKAVILVVLLRSLGILKNIRKNNISQN